MERQCNWFLMMCTLKPGTPEDLRGDDMKNKGIILDGVGPKIIENNIYKLESSIGFTLSSDYREFLLKYNGGQPTLNEVKIHDFPQSPTDVQVFFGINRSVKTSDICWYVSEFPDIITRIGVPIACDSGGALFILSPNKSVVYLLPFDHESKVYAVASTFSVFWESLKTV